MHVGENVPDIRMMLLEFETEKVGRLARESAAARNALIAAFSDASETVRERALLAAIEVSDPSLVNDIARALLDADDNVRIAAAQALAWYRQPRTIPILFEGLKDKCVWVRSHCAAGLSKLLNGPIWARVPSDVIDKLVNGLADMTEEEVRSFLTTLKVKDGAIDKYIMWRNRGFDVEIDTAMFEAGMTTEPIILEGAELPPTAAERAEIKTADSERAEEVERILSELPESLRSRLPEEDLRRLTPTTARELVDSLKSGFVEEKEEESKKPVRVVRVKKVKRVVKKPGRDELIDMIPVEVRDALPPGTLDTLSMEELEALVATGRGEDSTRASEDLGGTKSSTERESS